MAVYYVYSGAAGSNNGSSWANAFTTLTTAFATEIAGDTLYVAHDHAESIASALTLTSSGIVANPTKIVCVNRSGSVPPVSADLRATATVSTTGNTSITFAGSAHYHGIIFTAGNLTGTANITCAGSTAWTRFDNCSLRLGSSGVLSKIFSPGGGGGFAEFNNTTVSFTHASHGITITGGAVKWRNTSSALLGTISNALFSPSATRGGSAECIGVDLSAAGSGKMIVQNNTTSDGTVFRFLDCKLNAAVTKSAVPLGPGASEVDFIRSGSSGLNYTVHRHRMSGLLVEETTIIRTGGASDGTTALSWRIDTTADCTYSMPFECPVIAIWNDTTGSAVTATVEGVWGGGAVPLNNEIFLETEFLGDASSPMGSFVHDGPADLLATAANQTSSSATWGGSTTKFKLESTFTPQMKGWVYCRVKIGKASTTAYIDPLVTLS